jgi:hypothetical protein
MTAKQPAGRLSLSVIHVLSTCVLVALAAGTLYLGSGSPIRPRVTHKTASVAKPQFLNANSPANTDASHQRVLNAYSHLPLAFDANQGQTDPQVKYLARGNGYTLFLASNKAVLSMSSVSESPLRDAMFRRYMGITRWQKLMRQRARYAQTQMAVLNMEIVGANPHPQIAGQELLPGVTNYLIGNDPNKWRTRVPQYARVAYEGVYPGVDLAFHGEQRKLEFDFLVAPQADPAPIGLQFTGATRMALDESGDLVLTSAAGDVTMKKPVAYQESNGLRQPVEASFVTKGHGQVGLALGHYDRSRELVIDPALNYATYLGGSGEEEAFGIALDSNLDVYVTGDTNSGTSFPGSPLTKLGGGGFDAFVTKLKGDGSTILYTTLIGGSNDDFGTAIAVDALGDAFVAGGTQSNNFPPAGTQAQPLPGGGTCGGPPCPDAFLAELDPTGAILLYSTYLGGNNSDVANAMVIDNAGNAYLGGETFSAKYTNATGTVNGKLNGNDAPGGPSDGFVAKIDNTGALVFFTYLGGSNGDLISGITLDAGAPDIIATGDTISTDFPFTTGAFQTKCGTDGNCNPVGGVPQSDAFVTKLDSGGSLFVYSTYLGGSGADVSAAITSDSSNFAYVTGNTDSTTDFPTTNGSFQPKTTVPNTSITAFVTQVKPDGSGLGYSSYLGGSVGESGQAIALDPNDNAYVTGVTTSPDFPPVDAFQGSLNGNSDAFVTEIDPTGATRIYSSFLGGSGDENLENSSPIGGAITVDPSFVAYVAGVTTSQSGLAKNATGVQPAYGGGITDAFVAQVSAAGGSGSADFSIGVSPASVSVASGQTSSTITVTVTGLNIFTGTVTLSCPSGLPTGAACNFSPASVQLFTTAQSATSNLTISTTSATPNGTSTVNVKGTSGSLVHTAGEQLTVSADFSISLSPTSVSVAVGQTSSSIGVSVNSLGGFSGTVALSCTGLPAGAGCAFGSSSLPVGAGTGAATTLTISTTPKTSAQLATNRNRRSGLFYAMWLPIAGVALLGAGFPSRRRKLLLLVVGCCLLAGLIVLPSCSSSGGGGGGGGTPPGTYTVNVTGTSGSLTHTAAETLTVTP